MTKRTELLLAITDVLTIASIVSLSRPNVIHNIWLDILTPIKS